MRPDSETDPTYGYTAHLPGVSFESRGQGPLTCSEPRVAGPDDDQIEHRGMVD